MDCLVLDAGPRGASGLSEPLSPPWSPAEGRKSSSTPQNMILQPVLPLHAISLHTCARKTSAPEGLCPLSLYRSPRGRRMYGGVSVLKCRLSYYSGRVTVTDQEMTAIEKIICSSQFPRDGGMSQPTGHTGGSAGTERGRETWQRTQSSGLEPRVIKDADVGINNTGNRKQM